MSDHLPWDFKNPRQKQTDQTLIQQTVPRIAAAADTFMANTTPDPEPEGSLSDLNFWFQPPTAAPPPPLPILEEEEEAAPVETYKNIVRGLSKIEIIPAAYDLAGPREDDATAVTADFVFGSYEDHGGESSRTKRVNANARQQENSPGRASTKTRAVHHHPRRRSAEVHNMSERIRRDRIKKRIQTLQQLIPNCSTRDKESVLDCAIIHIKLLQHQITEMSMATSSSGFQAPYMFQGNYQGFHVPPRYGQFMHQMEHGFGMPVCGMPFAYPSPYRSNLASSQIPMFGGALSPNQMAFNPYRALPSYDTVGALSPNQMAFNPYRALPTDDAVGALSPNHQMAFNPYRALPTDDTVGALSPNQMAFNPYRALPTDDAMGALSPNHQMAFNPYRALPTDDTVGALSPNHMAFNPYRALPTDDCVGALSPNQMAFNPFGPLPSADTISVHSTSSSCSSQSEPISFDFGQLPTMIQGLAPSVPNSRVLPTQIITPSSSR